MKKPRLNITTYTQYERMVGYSRAVRIGNFVFVSGTSGVGRSKRSKNDAYTQAKRALERARRALNEVGADLEHVVRTRVFLSRECDWIEVARAHREFFGNILPASSMIVCSFIDHRILVEIEMDAIL